jgi:hypothetical protein
VRRRVCRSEAIAGRVIADIDTVVVATDGTLPTVAEVEWNVNYSTILDYVLVLDFYSSAS